MTKKYVVPLKEAIIGTLHGGKGTFRILIDKDISGAKHFSLLVNTSRAGTQGSAHKHDVEHCWYILSGTGNMVMGDKTYQIEPGMAVFTPAGVMHSINVDPGEDLTYVVIYAPPGPEQKLKELGAKAFEEK
jgi:mannose-6-phosphate isomerase-like protein (cupin superfamily)